jgi:hypothetical protein
MVFVLPEFKLREIFVLRKVSVKNKYVAGKMAICAHPGIEPRLPSGKLIFMVSEISDVTIK